MLTRARAAPILAARHHGAGLACASPNRARVMRTAAALLAAFCVVANAEDPDMDRLCQDNAVAMAKQSDASQEAVRKVRATHRQALQRLVDACNAATPSDKVAVCE